MSLHPDAAALLGALEARAGARLDAHVESRPWHSNGMAGTWLMVRIDAGRAATARLLAALPNHEFDLRGRLVADIVGEPTEGGAIIEALVLRAV